MEPRRFVPRQTFPADLVIYGVALAGGCVLAVSRGYGSPLFFGIWGTAFVLFFVVPLVMRLRRGLDTIDLDVTGLRVQNRRQTWHLPWTEIADVSTTRQNGTFLVVTPRGALVHKSVRLEGHEVNEQIIFDTVAWCRGAAYQQATAQAAAAVRPQG